MAPSELREYRYAPLLDSNSLRVLALRPAHEDEEEIDCEIVDIPLPDKCTEMVESGDCFDEEFRDRRFDGAKRLPELGHGDEWSDSDFSSEESVPGNSPVEQGERVIVRTQQGGIWEEENARQQYEALSWCWGRDPADEILRVHNRYGAHAIRISRNLKEALRVLRKTNETRHLWVDAICIDQKNIKERNEQVARMDKIYGRASNVCIWLGEASDDSALAIHFIRDRVLELWKFDELIEDHRYARYWAALLRLMRRPWFSRRWVVQEIALSAHGGTIYTGSDHVTWEDFADAVSLFVEVESATHRLSDVMKLDTSFGDIPNYFGDVSSLGAALLVDATSNLFRRSASGERQSLSSLEYLVSRMSAFKVTQPRDAIYALLAISRDGETQPPKLSNMEESELGSNILRYSETPPYSIDYKLPIIDFYQKFVQFCIDRADPRTALNVLVRPWAPIVMESDDDFESDNNSDTLSTAKTSNRDREIVLPSWICSLGKAAFEMEEHPTAGLRLERQNANPLVSLPNDSGCCVYSAAGEMGLDKKKFQFIKWDSIRNPDSGYPEYSMVVRGFILDEVFSVEVPATNGNIPYRWLKAGRWRDTNTNPPEPLWRTLVADRGLSSKDPPNYFPRACMESMKYKAKTMSKTGGYVDCRRMIEEGRCTIVAQFLRRVQEVVWNKHLITTKARRLGLVGMDVGPNFKVCILYGCSVPVILEEVRKSPRELAAEKKDRYKKWRKEFERIVSLCQSKYRLRALRREKAKERPIEVQVPANLGESLQWLGRQRKPSWPLRPTELLTCSMLAPLGKEIVVKSPDIRRNDALVTDEVVLSGQKMPSNAHLSAEQRALPYELSVLLPSQVEYRNGKRSDLIHSSSDRSRLDSRSVARNLNRATERISLEKQESNDGERSRVRTREEEQRRADEHARGREEFNARKYTEKHRNVPQPSYYRLFGECYIHGMMNGEAIKLQNESNIPAQVFELR